MRNPGFRGCGPSAYKPPDKGGCECEMSKPPYDPRAVANLLLDLAGNDKLDVSNLALQKLLYFAHAHFLIRTGHPLVQGGFEAWTYGPVHPAVYQAFKSAGDSPGVRATA